MWFRISRSSSWNECPGNALDLLKENAMRILVCVKQIIDVRVPLRVDRRKGTITPPSVPWVINRGDIAALEGAMSLRKKVPGCEVVALSVGPETAEAALHYCLARGGDAALRIWDENLNPANPCVMGAIIAEVTRLKGCSLVLCGMTSDDSCSAIVPALAAERLNWPLVNRVVEVKIDAKSAAVRQRGERGSRLEISCPLPSILAFDPSLSNHQYLSLRRLQAAEKLPIERCDLSRLGLSAAGAGEIRDLFKVVKVRQPKPRTKRTLESSQKMSGEEMMWQMIGGSSPKTEKANLLKGDPVEMADRLLEFLTEKGVWQEKKEQKECQ